MFATRFSFLTSIFILHLLYKERRNYERRYEERRNMFCIKKGAEILCGNEYFGVVIKVLTINFSWTDIHGKIFWQALKWLLLPGEDDDTFIPGYDVSLKQLHLRAWCEIRLTLGVESTHLKMRVQSGGVCLRASTHGLPSDPPVSQSARSVRSRQRQWSILGWHERLLEHH